MEPSFSDYLVTLRLKALSEVTIGGRRKLLTALASWCLQRDITDPGAMTGEVVDAYRRHLLRHVTKDGTPLSVRSQQQHLIAARGLFAWLAKQRLIGANPWADIELPKTPDRLPRSVLTVEQVEAVLAQPDHTTPFGLRDRAILEVFYATGLRRAEVCNLHIADVNLVKRTVFVREGKGAKDRVVPLGARAAVWVTRYLTDARPTLVGDVFDEPALFVTKDATAICLAHLGRIVERHLRAAGIAVGGSHLFRHTVATLMLEGGADVRWVQAMLGHRSLSSTQLYTHVDITRLAAVHAATHPATTNTPRHTTGLDEGDGDGVVAPVVDLRFKVRGGP